MTKINQSILEIWALSKIAFGLNGAILCALWLAEAYPMWIPPGFSLGYLIGCVAMLFNLHILGRGFAPVVHAGRGGWLAFASMIGSMLFLALAAFTLFKFHPQSLVGFAFGFVSLTLVGGVYAYRTLMRELGEESMQSPG